MLFALDEGPRGAPVLLLLHGFASSLHSFDRMAPYLVGDHRVVRVDLLGHGRSPQHGPGFGSEGQAGLVAAALAELGVVPETVLGHSFGADVAIALAEQDQRVRRVVVVGQAPDYGSARLPRGNRLLSNKVTGPWLHRLAPAAAVERASRFAFAAQAPAHLFFDRPDRRVLDFRATSPAMYRTVLVDRPKALAARGLDARLRDLGRPALVILGARDQLYPVAATRRRYQQVPGATVEVLAQSGHSPPLEEPEQTARLIRSFIASPLPRQPS